MPLTIRVYATMFPAMESALNAIDCANVFTIPSCLKAFTILLRLKVFAIPFCLIEFMISLKSFNDLPNIVIDLFAPVISSVMVLNIILVSYMYCGDTRLYIMEMHLVYT